MRLITGEQGICQKIILYYTEGGGRAKYDSYLEHLKYHAKLAESGTSEVNKALIELGTYFQSPLID